MEGGGGMEGGTEREWEGWREGRMEGGINFF